MAETKKKAVNRGLGESSSLNRLKGSKDEIYIRENTLKNRVYYRINSNTHVVCNKGEEAIAEARYHKNYPPRITDRNKD